MKTGLISLGLLGTLLLTGCDAGAKSVEWYKAHEKERDAKVAECSKDTKANDTDDCRNARYAQPNKKW
ncbi:EexN family lipoprotein [Pantoea sp. Mb-10]|uniref:EexN family lipoprotein n=1 Tax=unclassified Pantoea TaxID=2630326 RepID=UPI001E5D6D81|nr:MULTISPECIES: EexN family lipoprotein [unclassified Pantoea]MCE0491593.1 EexN family lipoprotein [Pantoea sp. Mb-10]MCE0502407.1 EexN family lipoprotein [Pantoea sp. Pb-8]